MSENRSGIPSPLPPIRYSVDASDDPSKITRSSYEKYKEIFKNAVPFESALGHINPYTGDVVSSMDDYILYCHCYYLKSKTEIVLNATESKLTSANAETAAYRVCNQKLQMRNNRLFYSTLVLSLVSLFMLLLLVCNIKPKESSNGYTHTGDVSYASGYDDALHGLHPSAEDVKCYSCGAAYSDYTEIHFYEISSVYVPICENCAEKHDYTNPIEIFGEEFSFSSAIPKE